MNKRCLLFLFFALVLVQSFTFSAPGEKRFYIVTGLNEDDALFECDDSDFDDEYYDMVPCNISDALCLECYSYFISQIDEDCRDILKNIPTIPNSECSQCKYRIGNHTTPNKTIYAGYLEHTLNKTRPFLERQIALTLKYPDSQVYWVETSEKAAEINDIACVLFHDLFTKTILKHLSNFKPWGPVYSKKEKVPEVHIAATCFHFSDYYQSVEILKGICSFIKDKERPERSFINWMIFWISYPPFFLKCMKRGYKKNGLKSLSKSV